MIKKFNRLPRTIRSMRGQTTEFDEESNLLEEFDRRIKDAEDNGNDDKAEEIYQELLKWYKPIVDEIIKKNEIARQRKKAREDERRYEEDRQAYNKFFLKTPGSLGYRKGLYEI